MECECLQRVSPEIPTDSVMLMLRLIIQFLLKRHSRPLPLDPGLRTFQQLMSREGLGSVDKHLGEFLSFPDKDELRKDAARCEAFTKALFTLSKLFSESELPPVTDVFDIFGKMIINTFTICDGELQDIGSGIYLSASCLDHDCHPNAVATFRGRQLRVRAVDNIAGGEISEVGKTVFISYLDQLAPSGERRQALQRQYYFDCLCCRCTNRDLDELMMYGKTKSSTDGILSPFAGHPDSASLFDDARQLCQKTLSHVDKMKMSSDFGSIFKECLNCISSVKDSITLPSVYVLRVFDQAFDAAIAGQMWEEALRIGKQTLQPYKHLLPPFSPSYAVQLLRVAKIQLWLGQYDQAHSTLAEAEPIVSVTHGSDSELYRQVTLYRLQSANRTEQWSVCV